MRTQEDIDQLRDEVGRRCFRISPELGRAIHHCMASIDHDLFSTKLTLRPTTDADYHRIDGARPLVAEMLAKVCEGGETMGLEIARITS